MNTKPSVDVKLPEEQIVVYLHIIQRLMIRMGLKTVTLTDKDDPVIAEEVKISFNTKKLALTIDRIPSREIN